MFGMKVGAAMIAATTFLAGAAHQAASAADEVNVYTYRQPELIEPIFDRFTAETGVKVNVLFAKKGLLERIQAEGANSPADLVIAPEVGLLIRMKEAGVTQPVQSDALKDAIPAKFRDGEGHWVGLTSRSRVFFVAPERVETGALDTYEDLADPRWKGRICIRSGQHPYNIALFSAMIARDGVEKTEEFLRGLKANLARKPQGGDRDQIKAVAAGECDIAVGNTYYYGGMLASEDQRAVAEQVKLVYPAQDAYGAHMNVSGAVMVKSAPNAEAALKLLEFMVTDEAQKIYAEANYEYPVKPGVEQAEIVKAWGDFVQDDIALDRIAEFQAQAVKLVDKVQFDEGPSS